MKFNRLTILSIIILVLLAAFLLLFPDTAGKQQENSAGTLRGANDAATGQQADKLSTVAGSTSGDINRNAIDNPAENTSNNGDSAPAGTVSDRKVAELMEQHLAPAMREKINQRLQPDGAEYPVIETDNGSYVDLSQRATTVPIAIVDDDGELVVTDITNPLPIIGEGSEESDAGQKTP